ncbi:MAG: ABC transporter permease, partial [Cytophagales bacterium]|nr:ABC transporter permease [Cytophagales bacterium]
VVQHTQFAGGEEHWGETAYPLPAALRADFPALERVTQAAGPYSRIISAENGNGELVRFPEDGVLFVDPYYPRVFDFRWLAGNPRTALSGPSSVVLTKSLADKYFGPALASNQPVLGRRMKLNDKDELLVTGIVADPPRNVNLPFGMLVSYDFYKRNNPYFTGNWHGNYQGSTFVVLPEGYRKAVFEKQLAAFKAKYLSPEYNARVRYLLQPLKEIHTNPFYSNPGSYVVPGPLLPAVGLVGVFIVLIAAVNFINLATAQAARRSREVGVRKALGSSRAQLFGQFMGETAVLSAAALLLAVTFTQVALSQINALLAVVALDLRLDAGVVGFAVATTLLVTLLAGFYPALVLSGYNPVAALKNRINTPSRGGLSLRRVLITGQFALAQLLIIGTIVVAAQMQYFRQKDMGFRRDAVVTVPLHNTDSAARELLREKLNRIAGVGQVSFSSGVPMSTDGRQYGTSFWLSHEPENAKRGAELKGVDTEYLALFDLKLVAGTWFGREDVQRKGFNGFVVNEKLVKQLGLTPQSVLGKILFTNEDKAPVIGVVRDFHNNSLQEEISPCVMVHWGNMFDYANLRLQPVAGDGTHLPQTLAAVEIAWREVFPDGFYRYDFLDDQLAQLYTIENLIFKGILVFAALAIFISVLGLYGLVTFMAVQRTKEVGIRKVLGASVPSIVVLFCREFLGLVGLAFAVAAPLAAYLMQAWLEGFSYRVALHPFMFAGALLGALGIAALTIGYQSIRAAVANPVQALRNE